MTMYVPENFMHLVTEKVDATSEDWLTDELIQELNSAMPSDSDIDKSTTCRDVTRLATECARIFHNDRVFCSQKQLMLCSKCSVTRGDSASVEDRKVSIVHSQTSQSNQQSLHQNNVTQKDQQRDGFSALSLSNSRT